MEMEENKKKKNSCPTPKQHSSSFSSYNSYSTTLMEDEDDSKKFESSPLRSPLSSSHCEPKPYSPPRLLPPPPPPPDKSQSNAINSVDGDGRTTHLLRSPPSPLQTQPPPESVQLNHPTLSPSPVIVVNRSMRDEVSMVTTKVDPGGGRDGFAGVEEGGDRRPRPPRPVSSALGRQRREVMVKKAALGFRLCAVVFCLISFSVMAADKTRGWAGDSFDRYKEYRYCLSVAVIGFVYSGFQAYDLAYHMVTGKHIIRHHLRPLFDFSMDQILTYLLISASSAAASRVDDWQANWGKDEFTEMASASVGMSFLAFTSFAFSSLISGYYLCTPNYT